MHRLVKAAKSSHIQSSHLIIMHAHISSLQSIPVRHPDPAQCFRCLAVSSYSRCFSVWAVKDKWWETRGSAVSNEEQSVRHLCSIQLHPPQAKWGYSNSGNQGWPNASNDTVDVCVCCAHRFVFFLYIYAHVSRLHVCVLNMCVCSGALPSESLLPV